MKRETLHSFFDGTATSEEVREEVRSVKEWLAESEEHMKELISERAFFRRADLVRKRRGNIYPAC